MAADLTQTPAETVHTTSQSLPDADDNPGLLEKQQQSDTPSNPPPEDSSSPSDTEPQAAAPRSVTGLRWVFTLVGVLSANLLYGLDTTIAASIQASVSSTFENSISELGWLGYGFGLGSSVAILPLGKAYGLFNVKWLYLLCLVQFAAGSALCGAAPSMAALIVGRVWAGIGGAGMYLG